MEIDEIQQLVDIIREAKISELTVSSDRSMIRLRKSLSCGGTVAPSARPPAPEPTTAPESPATEGQAPVETSTPSDLFITAPMVGILHRIDGIAVGTTVNSGQPICAIESMKLMNDVVSEHEGVIAEILADDGVPVEYGQPLFRLEAV